MRLLLASPLLADTSPDDALRIFDIDDSSPDAARPKPAPKPLPKSALVSPHAHPFRPNGPQEPSPGTQALGSAGQGITRL